MSTYSQPRISFTNTELLVSEPVEDSDVYPSNVKRVVVKGEYRGNLEMQIHTVSSSTFTTISRSFYDLYEGNTEFEEF